MLCIFLHSLTPFSEGYWAHCVLPGFILKKTITVIAYPLHGLEHLEFWRVEDLLRPAVESKDREVQGFHGRTYTIGF